MDKENGVHTYKEPHKSIMSICRKWINLEVTFTLSKTNQTIRQIVMFSIISRFKK